MSNGQPGRGLPSGVTRHYGGMTLVELLVLLGIIVMIVGMSVPALSHYADQLRLKTATRQVVGLILLARSMAISAHADHAVVIDPEQRRVTILNVTSGETLEQKVHLPSSVSVEVQIGGQPSEETKVVFRPTGSLVGRSTTLILSDREKRQLVTVTGATGAVTVE